MRKLVGWLFAAVVLMAGVGCTTSHPNPSSTGVTAKVSPDTATTVHASSGLTVTIPAHAVAGPGTVTVSPVTRDGQSGWHVDLTGTTLTAPATLTFPGTPQAGEPAPLVTYATTADGPLSLADGVQLGAGGASVSTTHFSFWFVTWWSSLMGKVKAAWEQVMAPSGTGAAPTCTGSDQLKASGPVVAASTDDRVAWCAGLSPAGKPRVSVVNARGYPMSVLATSHMVLTNQDQSWQSAFAQLMSTLGHGTAPKGMSRDVLPPGAGYTYDDTGSDTQGVQITADGAAYVANALLYSIDTILFAADASGQHTTMLEVVKDFADTSECFSSGRDLFSAQVTSLDQATSVTVSAIEAWSGCLGKVMEKVYKDRKGLTMLSGAIWLLSGAKQVIAAGEVVKDAFTLSGKPFTIVLTPAASSTAGSACEEQTLRAAREPGGDDPLLAPGDSGAGTWYDSFIVHACTGSWALVESSHTSGSMFSFWLMQAHGSTWSIVANTGVRLDTPLSQPLFTRADLQAAGLDPVAVSTGLGTNSTKTGRPIVEGVSASPDVNAQLASLTAPAMCNRPATKLVNGVIPGLSDQDGFTGLADGPGDRWFSLTGPAGPGGVTLSAVVFSCSAGGVAWPQVIGLYDSSWSLRGSINLGDLDQQEHSNVTSLTMRSGVLHGEWVTNSACHTGADVTVPRSADFTISASWAPVTSNLVTGQAPPCS